MDNCNGLIHKNTENEEISGKLISIVSTLCNSSISTMDEKTSCNNGSPNKKSLIAAERNHKYKRKKNKRIVSIKGVTLITSMATLYLAYELASFGVILFQFAPVVRADFSDNCPSDCNCKWANGKREADCTRGGFTTIPTNLDHEIQILRMTHNYVRKLGKNVFHSTGLINLQRIYMNHCHVQVRHLFSFSNVDKFFVNVVSPYPF